MPYIANIFPPHCHLSFDLAVGVFLPFFAEGVLLVYLFAFVCFHIYAVECIKLFFGGLWIYKSWLDSLSSWKVSYKGICSCFLLIKSQLVHEKGNEKRKLWAQKPSLLLHCEPDIAHLVFFSVGPAAD